VKEDGGLVGGARSGRCVAGDVDSGNGGAVDGRRSAALGEGRRCR